MAARINATGKQQLNVLHKYKHKKLVLNCSKIVSMAVAYECNEYCMYIIIGGDRPLVKDLHRHVLTNVAEKWDDLGYQLLVRPYQENLVNIIRKDYPNNSIDCCKRVLKEWLDTTEDATWDQLISALRSPSVRLHHFADQLEHMLTAECKTL